MWKEVGASLRIKCTNEKSEAITTENCHQQFWPVQVKRQEYHADRAFSTMSVKTRINCQRRAAFGMLILLCFLSSGPSARGERGFLQIRNGYFWEPATAGYFVARGVAYQTWNPPVGANQTFEQLEYDLVEFKKL